MIRLYLGVFILAGALSLPLSVCADSSETITTETVPAVTQSTRTTESSANPVVIQDAYGNRAIVQPAGATTSVDTVTQSGEVKEKTVEKKKTGSHHLINFLGLKVL